MSIAVLKTKLHVPPLRPDRVPRPRVIECLREGATRPLILICAPAGFGKTTLVTEWLDGKNGLGSRVAWLMLDENDNDPLRFLSYLLAALQRIDPTIGTTTQAMMQSPQPPPSQVLLTALANDLAALPSDFFLVLDDYHVIHTLAIHQQLTFLLNHQPAPLHLIIVSREDPPLPLARLRARGQVLEIRQADLRFTEDETAELMRRAIHRELSRDNVAALHRRTEGWIAGLQLACLSLRDYPDADQFIESFTGSHRFVLDYLMEEVFAQQPSPVREFLLKTSILERMCGQVCDAVVDWKQDGEHWKLDVANEYPTSNFQFPTSSQSILQHLEHTNLFIVPLDDERQWYRYHRLFADLLHHRLQMELPNALAELNNRASHWFALHGFSAEAIRHALAAQNWETATTLILGECASLLTRGEIVTMRKWLEALPEEIRRGNPELCLNHSWALILTGQLDAAEASLAQAEAVAQNITPLLGNIYAAQAHIARSRGDHPRTIQLSQKALASMPADAVMEKSVVALNLGIAYLNQARVAEAEQSLVVAEKSGQQSGNHHVRLIALTCLGTIQVIRGKLHRGQEFFQQAIRSDVESPATALAHLHYGALLYEWNNLNAASEHLQHGLELSRQSGNPEVEIAAYRTLALLKQAQGDASAGRAVIEQAYAFARDHHLPSIMHAAIAAIHVQLALAQNDLPTALRWAEQVTQNPDASPFYPTLGLTRARVMLAQKQLSVAATELNKCYQDISHLGWEGGLITIRVLQSLAADDHNAQIEFLTDALTRAQPESYIRTFADTGEALLPLLQDVALRGIFPDYVGKIIAAIKRKPSAPAQSLVEPLSEREIKVLRLVAAGLSNAEIAKQLILSKGTVKTHVHNIFGKLDAQNRAQAIARAREAGIV